MPRLFLAAAALLLLAGCDTGEPFDVSIYTGLYAGTRTITSEGETETESINASLSESDGDMTLTLIPLGGDPETLRGRVTSSGFYLDAEVANGDPIRIDVGPDGVASGEGIVDVGFARARLTVEGQFTGQRIDLRSTLVTEGSGEVSTAVVALARSQ